MALVVSIAILLIIPCLTAKEITDLPGVKGRLNFKQYSGYLDAKNGAHLFYWFLESQKNPENAPLLLWLTGGPGCSSLSALLTEWGPWFVDRDGHRLIDNPYSWNTFANVLAIESPAGVGFSFNESGAVATNDQLVAEENYHALLDFFKQFPSLKKNDFYVTGESYGGIYVPTLTDWIIKQNVIAKDEEKINLKGMAIGNGCVSEEMGIDTIIQFQFGHGIIDERAWRKVKDQCCKGQIDYCEFSKKMDDFGFCPAFSSEYSNYPWFSGMNPYNILDDCSYAQMANEKRNPRRLIFDFKQRTGLDVPPTILPIMCLDETGVMTYLNRPEVLKALGLDPKRKYNWDVCSDPVSYSYTKIYPEMQSRVENILKHGYRVMLYYGDVDMACNFLLGQRFMSLVTRNVKQYQSKRKFIVDHQVGGFHTKYGNADFVVVRAAGHMVPTDKPNVALHIIKAFVEGKKKF